MSINRIRDLVDDLYDMIQTPTHEMSEVFLEINKELDNQSRYIESEEMDINNDDLVNELTYGEIHGCDPTKF